MPAAEGEPFPFDEFPVKRDGDFRLVCQPVQRNQFAVQFRSVVIAEQRMLRDAVLAEKFQPHALPIVEVYAGFCINILALVSFLVNNFKINRFKNTINAILLQN